LGFLLKEKETSFRNERIKISLFLNATSPPLTPLGITGALSKKRYEDNVPPAVDPLLRPLSLFFGETSLFLYGSESNHLSFL